MKLLEEEIAGPSNRSHYSESFTPVRHVQENSQRKTQLSDNEIPLGPSPMTPTLVSSQPLYVRENYQQNILLLNNEISGHTWQRSTSTQSYQDSSQRNIIPDNQLERDISSEPGVSPFSTNNTNWNK